ncbi:MAG: DUF4332 domain-containing protein [Anaerolineae bacterium]
MDRQAFIDWLKQQKYAGKIQAGTPEALARLDACLDRLEVHLNSGWSGIDLAEIPLHALQQFPLDLKANDDGNLGSLFSFLGRDDLVRYMGQVSARKYFMNKTLPVIFKYMPEMLPAIRLLGKLKIRMASELQSQGATPAGRTDIAQRSGLSEETVLLIVKCCDLCRMTGMAGQALRRSLAMGYDTLAKFRATTPEGIRADVAAYLERTGERSNTMIDYAGFIRQAIDLVD